MNEAVHAAVQRAERPQQRLLENFRSLVSDRIKVSIALCGDIRPQKSGKYKWVSQEYYVDERRLMPAQLLRSAIGARDVAISEEIDLSRVTGQFPDPEAGGEAQSRLTEAGKVYSAAT